MSYGPRPCVSVALDPEARRACERLAAQAGTSVAGLLKHLARQLAEKPHFVQAHLLAGACAPEEARR